jgi:hypothetical protein
MMRFDMYGLIEEAVSNPETTSEVQTVHASFENGHIVFERDGERIHPVYKEYWDLLNMYQQYEQAIHNSEYEDHARKNQAPQPPSFFEKTWEIAKESSFIAAESFFLSLDAYSVYMMACPRPQAKLAGVGMKIGSQGGKRLLNFLRSRAVKTISAESSLSTSSTRLFNQQIAKQVKQNTESRIGYIEKRISEWLGPKTRMIKNEAGDPVFVSFDQKRKIRFDFKNTHGESPHMHLEKKINNRWEDASGTHRIYPKG